ncbi:hypothetical protein PCIT_a3035 [Pseudoalteromonas citrea]|uniref:Uncharacterized protein n=2 Tax=Pseudoalteromonas citrea TaxID=43655 RepID=A0AAD4FRQ6_9GAMM|nr:hypothetical protein [Pseudoalteromonas citrea]KAF7770080.1 hypothetical protein PCIT_a3035 [Pseudoalteromonas citrea]
MQSVELTEPVLRVLRPALFRGKGTIKREIRQGISQLHRVGELFIVTRKEAHELVIVAVAGRNLLNAIESLINYARQLKCSSIRWHTRNPEYIRHGFANLPAQLVEKRRGILYDEYVYRLVLNGR